jgi:hypothetical protein
MPSAVRSFTRAIGGQLQRPLDLASGPIGSDGWLSTGASIRSSTIIPRANPPVKHMPTAPHPASARLVGIGSQCPQPDGHRSGAVGRERGELLRDARPEITFIVLRARPRPGCRMRTA